MTKRSLLLVLAHGILGWGSPAAGREHVFNAAGFL